MLQKTALLYCSRSLWWNVFSETPLPFVKKCLTLPIILRTQASINMISCRYVWLCINKDIDQWTRANKICQQPKMQWHNRAPIDEFLAPYVQFQHIHMNIVGPLTFCRDIPIFWKWLLLHSFSSGNVNSKHHRSESHAEPRESLNIVLWGSSQDTDWPGHKIRMQPSQWGHKSVRYSTALNYSLPTASPRNGEATAPHSKDASRSSQLDSLSVVRTTVHQY